MRYFSAMHSSPRPTRARGVLMGFVLTLTAISYLDRVCISASKRQIALDLQISDERMGYVLGAFTFAYALFEVPGGWLADRFGPRLMITRIVVLWSIMTALTGAAAGFWSLLIVRLLFGMGEAGMFPGLARAFSRWIPGKSHGSIFGLSITAALVAGAFTPKLVVKMLGVMSWRWTFPIFGILGTIWALAWFVWFRDDPHKHPGVNAAELALIGEGPPRVHEPVPWRALLADRNLLALCFCYFGIIYGWYFYLTWMFDYLQRARGFNSDNAANLSGLPLLAMALAVFSGGFISDALCKKWGLARGRRRCGLLTLPIAAVLAASSTFISHNLIASVILALAVGFASMSVASAWATTLDIGGKHAGVVSGSMNMLGNIGGALISVVVGHCVEHWGKTDPWLAWHVPILTTAACYVLSFVCWMLIDASRPIADA